MIAAGQYVGSCEILQRLGRGGVGDVFAGVDRMLNRPIAIKALRPEFSENPGFVTRFRAEAESLARLNHPNIATLYSLQREGNRFFMIMELVRGRTLEEIIQAAGRLSEQDSLALIAQAVDGLSYAHKAGVVHRDIKPANLMVTTAGVLKIMDFGIARMRGSERLTRQGRIVGTLAYMAPEQIRGLEVDERTDIYSLASVLYELISGSTPFVSDSEYELIRLQVEAAPPRLVDRVAGLSAEVEATILRSLAKDPAERFPTMEAFGQSLGVLGMGAQVIEGVRHRFSGLAGQITIRTFDRVATRNEDSGHPRTRLATPLNSDNRTNRATRLASNANCSSTPASLRAAGFLNNLGMWPLVLLATMALLLVLGVTYIALDLFGRPSLTALSPVSGEKSATSRLPNTVEPKAADKPNVEPTVPERGVRAASEPDSNQSPARNGGTPPAVEGPVRVPSPTPLPPLPVYRGQDPSEMPAPESPPPQEKQATKVPSKVPSNASPGSKGASGWKFDRGK